MTPSLASPTGFIVHSHAGDRWQDCRDHVASLLGIRNEIEPAVARSAPPSVKRMENRTAGAVELWKTGLDPRGTVVERYLQSRGLNLPDEIASTVIRFASSCPWQDRRVPAMLTAFRSIDDDRLVAVHRTALTPDGQKIGRMMLGPVGGAAMKLDPDADVEQGLTIGEGFETCLGGRAMGFRPVWALGSAGAIGSFPALAGIDTLTILAEPDPANARAVEQCGNRWTDAGREVLVVRSQLGDMNDVVKASAA